MKSCMEDVVAMAVLTGVALCSGIFGMIDNWGTDWARVISHGVITACILWAAIRYRRSL